MKKNLLFAFALSVPLLTMANPITLKKAQSYADSFMKAHGMSGAVIAGNAPAAAKGIGGISADDSHQAYYVFNTTTSQKGKGAGFVIISGDDQMPRVLGYSLDGSWPADESRVPTPLKNALSNYSAYVDAVGSGAVASPALRTTDTEGQGIPVVGPLLTTKWNQSYPYNKYAPVCPDTLFPTRFLSHFPIGCVAVGMAQIINYWGQKTGKPVSPADHDTYATCINFFDEKQPTDTLFYSLSSDTKYDWANMPDSIGHNPDTVHVMSQEEWEREGEAVGVFLRDVAYSINMYWMKGGGGAQDCWSGDIMSNVFGFSNDSRYISTSGYGKLKDYIDLIKADFDKGWPVLAEGCDAKEGGGHCFVYDGYDSNDYIHVNWGWGGDCDAFFDLSYLKTNTFDTRSTHDYNFSTDQGITIGIHPREGIETPQLDNNNISFEGAQFVYDNSLGAQAAVNLLFLGFDDGTDPVVYLDKENNTLKEGLTGYSFHKSFGYDYDFVFCMKNADSGTVISDTLHNTTLKNPSRNASGAMNEMKDFSSSNLADGSYIISGYMREVLDGKNGEWLADEDSFSCIIRGKDLIVSPKAYLQYYHGKECAHHWQDENNNALIHVEFTSDPENISVGDSISIILEEQIAADNNLKYDYDADQQVLLTLYEDGQLIPDTLVDDTKDMKEYLENAKAGTFEPRSDAWKVPFLAEEKYAGKTLHLTYSWPALGISITNDIKVVRPTGIYSVDAQDAGQSAKDQRCYNLSGQQVGDSYRGILIQGGRKYIRR